MSLLVRCDSCQRQYDASGREIGSRFRCHCGVVVTVTEPKEKAGHNAQVVRCSSCGAPAAQGAKACGYCHADFTLHERDLNTVCPGCMARVSSKAKFCHSCGTTLAAEAATTAATDIDCPSCGSEHKLIARELGKDVTINECANCMGMWLPNSVFKNLLKKAKAEADSDDFGVGGGSKAQQFAERSQDNRPADAPIYRMCPECGHHMRRHIFAKRSGIIIDSCSEHGVWFDAEELDMILDWVKAGGTMGDDGGPAVTTAHTSRTANMEAVKNYKAYKNTDPDGATMGDPVGDLLGDAFGAIGQILFGHHKRR